MKTKKDNIHGNHQYTRTFFCSTLTSLFGAVLEVILTLPELLKSRNQSNEIRLSLAVAIGEIVLKRPSIELDQLKSKEAVIIRSCK